MLVIELENGIFNPKEIRSVFKKYIHGSNPYHELEISFIDGTYIHLRYEVGEIDKLKKDYEEFKNKVSKYNQLNNKDDKQNK